MQKKPTSTGRDSAQNPGEHPSVDELLSYQEKQLEPADHERVQAHLVTCASCASTVLDLARFPEIEAAPGRPEVTEAAVDASWRGLAARLADEPDIALAPSAEESEAPGGVEPRGVVADPSPTPWWRFFDDLARLRVAFSGLAAVTGVLLLAVLVDDQGGRGLDAPGLIGGPLVNLPIVELVAEGSSGGRSTDERIVIDPVASDGVLLVLTLIEPSSTARYEVLLRDPSTPTRVHWRSDRLTRATDGTFSLLLPAQFLDPGSYSLELFELGSGGPRSVATYPLTLHAPAP